MFYTCADAPLLHEALNQGWPQPGNSSYMEILFQTETGFNEMGENVFLRTNACVCLCLCVRVCVWEAETMDGPLDTLLLLGLCCVGNRQPPQTCMAVRKTLQTKQM